MAQEAEAGQTTAISKRLDDNIALLEDLVYLVFTKSFGVPYLWPLIPFNWTALKNVIVRAPVPARNVRPSILKPQDKVRQGVPEPALKRGDKSPKE